MVQDTFECVVGVFERTERLVELVADVVVSLIAQVVPPGQGWHPKRLAVEVGVFGELVGLILGTAALEFGCDEPFPLGLELVRGALKEQQPEDVLLELRRIHLAPQDVCGRQQMPLQLPQGQHVTALLSQMARPEVRTASGGRVLRFAACVIALEPNHS